MALGSEGSSSIHQCLVALIIGFVVGFSMTQLLLMSTSIRTKWRNTIYYQFIDYQHSQDLLDDEVSFTKDIREHTHTHEDSSVAQKLYKEVRVLCWIMTNPLNHQTKAQHVKKTWGKRCNKLLFMSSVEDKELGTIGLNVSEGRNLIWGKTKAAFKYIYEHHLDDADWFYKADDDTYAIMENMRYQLYPYSPETPIYFGARYKEYAKPNGYMSGGAGYVLSKEALRRFVTIGLPKFCRKSNMGNEDILMGLCLQAVNVTAGDSRDFNARGRYMPITPEWHLLEHPNESFWYWTYIYYKNKGGLECCSDYSVSFHYITPTEMYSLDYFVYHLNQYGIVHLHEKLPKRLEKGATMPPPISP